MDALLLGVQNAGQVVDKDDLIQGALDKAILVEPGAEEGARRERREMAASMMIDSPCSVVSVGALYNLADE